MAKQDGGAAFPHTAAEGHRDYRPGMSLRDYFAAQVFPIAFEKFKAGLKDYEIVQLCGDRTGIKGQELIAAIAYELADAMIERRSKAQ